MTATISITIVDNRRNMTVEEWREHPVAAIPAVGDAIYFDSAHDTRTAGEPVAGTGTVMRRDWCDRGTRLDIHIKNVDLRRTASEDAFIPEV